MRDLRAVAHDVTESRLDLGEEAAPPAPDIDAQIRVAKRDQQLAGIAVMLIDAAKLLEPVVALLSGHLLRWAALGGLIGLASFALRQPSWEKLAVVAVFGIVAPFVIRRGK